jgi:hypothetical protein
VLAVAGLLGIGVTYAEPAIGTLKLAGHWSIQKKPRRLYYLLMVQTEPTVLLVGMVWVWRRLSVPCASCMTGA